MKATLIYIIDPETLEVLLATKGRKVGAGFLFGYGGKLEDEDEGDARKCVCREFEKESGGISIEKYYGQLELFSRIRFFRGEDKNPLTDDPSFEVDCFRLFAPKAHFENIQSTDEMKTPEWIHKDAIPFDSEKMKPGDKLFVPNIIHGIPTIGYIWFEKENNIVLGHDIKICTKESLAA